MKGTSYYSMSLSLKYKNLSFLLASAFTLNMFLVISCHWHLNLGPVQFSAALCLIFPELPCRSLLPTHYHVPSLCSWMPYFLGTSLPLSVFLDSPFVPSWAPLLPLVHFCPLSALSLNSHYLLPWHLPAVQERLVFS